MPGIAAHPEREIICWPRALRLTRTFARTADLNAFGTVQHQRKTTLDEGNLVAFMPNAKTFWKNLSPITACVTILSRPCSCVTARQNHPPAPIEVKSGFDLAFESAA